MAPGAFGNVLDQVTKRCLRWRDAVDDVLRECETEAGVSPEALLKAQAMVGVTLDVTLVRMCEVFESERARTEEELGRRIEASLMRYTIAAPADSTVATEASCSARARSSGPGTMTVRSA